VSTTAPAPPEPRKDRLLPWIAAERGFRAIVLAIVGLALVTHPHANWATEATRFARHLGLDPNGNWIRRLIAKLRKLHGSEDVFFGAVALGYAVLEGVEAYGLWRRRLWAEWLTIVATSLLLIPEVWELTKSISLLKVGALLVNIVVVAYLVRRIRRA
jgi:uncharacterized membrane protein (DUF2068 family)